MNSVNGKSIRAESVACLCPTVIVDSDGKTCMAGGWNPLEASSPASLVPGLDSEIELPCKECLENQLSKIPEQKMQDFFRLHANL